MEKLLVILFLLALSGMRLYFKIRFHALFGIRAFRHEPTWIILTRYFLGAGMLAGFFRYLYGGRRLADGIVWDLRGSAWAGATLAVLGLALLFSAHRALDGNFSTTIEVGEGRRLVTTGPYARVRHPMYVAYLVIFAGLLGISRDPLFGVAGILVILSLMVLRVPYEERILRDRFGREYEEYKSRVGAFVPRAGASPRRQPDPADGSGKQAESASREGSGNGDV